MLKSICRNQFMFVIGLMLIATSNAHAQPGCDPENTAAECQEHIRQEQVRLQELQAGQAPTLLDIAKNADGTVNYMNQREAIQYCSDPTKVPQPAHLPSARELGRYSMSLGAKGIAEVAGGKPDNSYYLVSAINADGTADSFYFSYEGYQRPTGELGNNWFWSSSVDSNGSDYAFVLNGYDGDVAFLVYRDLYYAVRCVSGR